MAAGEGTLTEAGTVLGTAAYISPEQAAGEPASAASDVYSFGVMLYRMLTGRLPFESNDPMELVLMNRDQPPPPITEFRKDPPGLLESAALAALEKDPAERPQDGAALLAALGAAGATAMTVVAAADPADATRVLPSVPAAAAPVETASAAAPPPPPERSRVPLLVAALLVLLLAGGALAYEVTKPDSSNGGTPGQTLPTIKISTKSTTRKATTQPTTTAPPPTTTAPPTTTQQTTTRQHTTTTQPTTTAPPPTTTAPPPPPPTTTAPPPPPPTTTATPPPTTFTQPATTGP
jgi:eukaryotic-like serine/threonine-protein kinase